jgi:hypothetical protein
MMSTAPPLLLTREQASRLQAHLQTYRRYAFASLAPSIDRNTTLRMLQTMQGKLIDVMDQKTAFLQLVLTTEEMVTLKTIITELLSLYAKEPVSAKRSAILADLAALKADLKGYCQGKGLL